LNQSTTGTAANVTGTVAIANGGTGQTTQQAAINALTGTQSSGKVLRSDGTNATLSNIQAADVPTLNQNTTGSAASFTGSLAGDVTGTQGATVVSQVGGQAASAVASTVTTVNAATSAATASTLVKRDSNINVQVNNVSESFTSTATAAGTTTLTAASTGIQQFTGTTTQNVSLPATNATGMSPGLQFQIFNRSTGAVTVKDSSGTVLQVVAAGAQLTVTAATTGSPGSWDLSYTLNGASTPVSSGSKNYMSAYTTSLGGGTANPGNGDFELGNTTGWSLGTIGTLTNGLPTGTPTFGSGASGSLSLTATNSANIGGKWSGSYSSSAATTAGNMMASDPFFVDSEDLAKVLTVKFYYQAFSGASNMNFSGTSSNSYAWAIWDVNNAVWIPATGQFGMTQSSGVGLCAGTFQTPSSTGKYRFCLYNVNATAGAVNLIVDDFFIGPQTIVQGTPVTDWVAYTPTGTWVSNATYTGQWRRVGDTGEYVVQVTLTGAPTNTGLSVTIPSGQTFNTAKLTANPGSMMGSGYALHAATTYTFQTVYNANNSVYPAWQNSITTPTQNTLTATVPFTWASGDVLTLYFKGPITGWSSNVQMSNDTDTRVVSFSGIKTSTQAVTADVTDITFTSSKDSHAAWNGSQYVVQVSGDYVFSASAAETSSGTDIFAVYKNGSFIRNLFSDVTGNFGGGMALIPNCNAGDTLSMRCHSSITVNGGAATNNQSCVSIFRLSGPSIIAASESVNMRYTNTAGTTIGTTNTLVPFANKDYDSHGWWTGTQYNVGISGKFSVTAFLTMNGVTLTTAQTLEIQIFKNGSSVSDLAWTPGNGSSGAYRCGGSDDINCLAGDYLQIYAQCGVSGALYTGSGYNRISIKRTGN
jgi:hypothetical protein